MTRPPLLAASSPVAITRLADDKYVPPPHPDDGILLVRAVDPSGTSVRLPLDPARGATVGEVRAGVAAATGIYMEHITVYIARRTLGQDEDAMPLTALGVEVSLEHRTQNLQVAYEGYL